MVITGFSNIHVAIYSASGQTITYSGLVKLARSRSMSISLDTTDDNDYYADDTLAETESGASFSGGSADIGVDGLTGEEEALIYGIPTDPGATVQVNNSAVPELQFGDNMNPPFMGIGAVKEYQMNGVKSWRPIVLTKCQFVPSGDEANTREANIDWQSETLRANVMRDDSANHNWKRMPKENFDSLADAIAYITAVLGAAAAAAASTLSEEPAAEPAETVAAV